jgi:hypothetical protein
MIPNSLDLTFNRGVAFELELITQTKNYLYDPAVNNAPADLKRTHAENLEHYGFEYAYIDFLGTYDDAEFIVTPAWVRHGDDGDSANALMRYTTADAITFTDRSVQIQIEAADIQVADFDTAVYELLLTVAPNRVDKLVYGTINVHGQR